MESTNINQLSVVVLLLIVALISAIALQKKQITFFILLTIPFQFIENKYGTSGVAIAYLGMLTVWLKGWRVFPFPLAILGLGVAFVLSLIFATNGIVFLNIIYTVNFWSSIAVFYILYNYARVYGSTEIEKVLLGVNVLVLGYCVAQVIAGPGEAFKPFGIEAFEFHSNRGGGDPRLVGPFSAPGATATYLVFMVLVCLKVLHKFKTRLTILPTILLILNFAALAFTGNRGGLITAALGALIYVSAVANYTRMATRIIAAAGIVAVIASAMLATASSNFDTIIDRLGDVTESSDGLPETRSKTWSESVKRIRQTPWTGDGPYLLYQERAEQLGLLRSRYDTFPHSLYLYILRTLGVAGLVAFLFFFATISWPFRRDHYGVPHSADQRLDQRFLVFLIGVFLVNQITLEFMRISYMDLSQFIFAVLGTYAGAQSVKSTSQGVASDRTERP